jgi:hypothetical protein
MAVNHFAVAAHQTRNLETKFTNAAAHAVHSRIVLARVARVKDQLVDGPDLDSQEYFRWHDNALISAGDEAGSVRRGFRFASFTGQPRLGLSGRFVGSARPAQGRGLGINRAIGDSHPFLAGAGRSMTRDSRRYDAAVAGVWVSYTCNGAH